MKVTTILKTGALMGLSFLILACGGGHKSQLQIKGSDTMINLVQVLAEQYMHQDKETQVIVTGGGSGTGIAALVNEKTNLANASRKIKSKEEDLFKKKSLSVKRIAIGIDGLAVIVHPDNPLSQLSVTQAGSLYTGNTTNWKQLKGTDTTVTLYGRQSNSGTYGYFQKHVLNNKDYSAQMRRMNGNAQIVEAIKTDKSGIGYVGVGYVVDKNGHPIKGIKILKISKGADLAYSPITGTSSGHYPLARELNQYFSKMTPELEKFLSFELSEEGQKLVAEQGFFPLSEAKRNEYRGLIK